MALNPKTIKAMFSKLAPYADDAKSLLNMRQAAISDLDRLSSYADRALDAGVKHPALSRALQTQNVGDLYSKPVGGTLSKLNDAVNNVHNLAYNAGAIPFKSNINSEDFLLLTDNPKTVAAASPRKFPKNITGFPDPDFTFPETTSVLGDVKFGTRRIGDGVDGVYDIEGVLNPHYVFNQTLDRPLDTADMVLQSPELLRGIDYSDTDRYAFGIRPHRNTALGRWFAKNNPNYGWDMEEEWYF